MLLKRGSHPKSSPYSPPYKLLSLLLQYPDPRLAASRPAIPAAVAELPASAGKDAIERFAAYWAETAPSTLAQTYVETFDLQKRCSLYLTFYLYGDTRKRGMALLRLKHMYRAAGLVPEGPELPDYLPVMLEFAAFAPPGYGETVLREYRAALALIQMALREKGSPYLHLLDALCAGLPEMTLPDEERLRRLIAEGPPHEQVGLEPFAPPEVMPISGVRR
jgi:nitrate reductase delta subunit